MNSSGHSNVVSPKEVVVLNNCQGGIGIKIVGGKTYSGPTYGIFVKKTIPGSPAARNNCLREGDKILKVNKSMVTGFSNERAISLLLNASRAGVVTFLIDRSEISHREYLDLLGTLTNELLSTKYANFQRENTQSPDINNERAPETVQKRSWVLAGGRMSPLSRGRTSPGCTSPRLANLGMSEVKQEFHPEKGTFSTTGKSSYGDCDTNGERPASLAESNGDSGLQSSSSTLNNLSHLTVANITLTNGLGMSITGGVNHADGPSIVVKELINGGDVDCNGEIKQGDQIVSINGESFLNITHEEARMKLTRMKLRTDKEFEITFTNQRHVGSVGNGFGEEEIKQSTVAGTVVLPKSQNPSYQAETNSKHELSYQPLKPQTVDQNGNYSTDETHPKDFSPTEHFSSIMQSSIQPSSIPFYLQQDLAVTPELFTTNTSHDVKHQGEPSTLPRRRLSLAPASKLRVEKLEVALRYLGIHLAPEQQEEIRRELHMDATGLVSYGEFVNVAQKLLSVELQDHSQTLNQGRLRFAVHDIEKNGLKLDYPMASPNGDDTVIEELRRQRDDAIAEARDLRYLLEEKSYSRVAEADRLESIKRTAEEALEESLALKDQVYVATQANMAANKKDDEYEEIIKILEEELHLVKTKGTPKQQELQDLQKKVVVLGCQLRKIEVIKRTYEVATERLLSFADHVHDCLKRGAFPPSSVPSISQNERAADQNQQPPSYLSQKHASQKLADEARDLVRGVRVLLEEEPLPFGWEEAYTSDGERYFVNHVTQYTSWFHPITHVKKEKSEEV